MNTNLFVCLLACLLGNIIFTSHACTWRFTQRKINYHFLLFTAKALCIPMSGPHWLKSVAYIFPSISVLKTIYSNVLMHQPLNWRARVALAALHDLGVSAHLRILAPKTLFSATFLWTCSWVPPSSRCDLQPENIRVFVCIRSFYILFFFISEYSRY